MFYHATDSYRPSVGAEPTQFNTLCSSFITCSISSDFIGGLEYWPESSPCPSLALAGGNNSNYYSISSQTGFFFHFVSVLNVLFMHVLQFSLKDFKL